ncbi:MAG: DUF2807 domain-containing protein [Urechidicola sp.]|nr:DUF2807 domain-containing protein [Urechidicola sp.]
MKKILILFLLVSTVSFSQETIKVKLGTFDEIKVFSGLKITLQSADVAGIEISGKKSSDLVYKNVNGRLKLSMRFPETFNAHDVNVIVYFSEEIHFIDVNEGAVISSSSIFKQQNIELKAQEGASINLNLDVKYLTVRSVTGGFIRVKGTANNKDIEATSGGAFDGYDLESDSATVLSSSGALVKVKSKDVLNATVRLGGTIYYKGKPSQVITEKIIGGTIESKD